jgi:hypothetical protein
MLSRRLKTRALAGVGDFTIVQKAREAGIAPNTLRAVVKDTWTQLSRTTLERIADAFQLSDATELFEFEPCDFWNCFADDSEYYLVRNDQDYVVNDNRARQEITTFLQRQFPSVRPARRPVPENIDEVAALVQSSNLIIVGSVRSNQAMDAIISFAFGAKMGSTLKTNRARVPFRFVFPRHIRLKSAAVESYSPKRGHGSGVGIVDGRSGKFVVEADWRSRHDYEESQIERGKDCALLLILQGTSSLPRKTIVLAGLSSIGTQAAARALIHDFRELEPADPRSPVIAILEATYRKPARGERVLLGYHWKLIQGSKRALNPAERPTVTPA